MVVFRQDDAEPKYTHIRLTARQPTSVSIKIYIKFLETRNKSWAKGNELRKAQNDAFEWISLRVIKYWLRKYTDWKYTYFGRGLGGWGVLQLTGIVFLFTYCWAHNRGDSMLTAFILCWLFCCWQIWQKQYDNWTETKRLLWIIII